MNRKKIDKVYHYIFNKRTLFLLGGILLFLLFHSGIEAYINKTLVNHALAKIQSHWLNDVVFGSITALIIFYLLYNFKKYTPSIYSGAIIGIFAAIYFYYRLFSEVWVFTSFSFTYWVKYADIIILFCIAQVLLLRSKKSGQEEKTTNSFFDDDALPVEESDDKKDEFGYTRYAEQIADKINNSHFSNAFAIGINGKWGQGKTSFINLIKRYISGDNIIHIDFNAWNSNNPKAIVQDFFETMQENIRPYHSFLSRLLINYSHKLVTLNSNTVTRSIQATIAAVTGFESVSKMYMDINDTLKKIDKKIVVYIDDLDRLDKEEIIEVIRLIRNTANFYNTFFIVAYDRNYVVNALREHNIYNSERFLEKIFQLEINLPYFQRDVLRNKLAEKLKVVFPEEHHQLIEENVIGESGVLGALRATPDYLNEWLNHKRDVSRLANALSLNLKTLLGEIEFSDFLRLEIIRLKYPAVYELLHRQTEKFFQTHDDRSNRGVRYQLKRISDEDKGNLNEDEKKADTYLMLYLIKNQTDVSVPQVEIEPLINFIASIFRGTNYGDNNALSVIYPSKFRRYFAYGLMEGELSELEFSVARSSDLTSFQDKIQKWVFKGLERELINRFLEIKAYDDKEDFEKVILSIFFLANLRSKNQGHYSNSKVGYEEKDLVEKLSYPKHINDKYYSERENGVQEFVRDIFQKATPPYIFEANIIRRANYWQGETFALKKEELESIALSYFKSYCEKTNKLNSNIWHLFNSCKQTEWIPTGINAHTAKDVMLEEAREILRNFVTNKDFDGFLVTVIRSDSFDKKFYLDGLLSELFGSWENFDRVLEGQDEAKWKYLSEFKKFFSKVKEKNFTQKFSFQFNDIPIGQNN